MRIIKNNTLRYEAFHKTLPSISRGRLSSAGLALQDGYKEEIPGTLNKEYNSSVKILEFARNIKSLNSISAVEESLKLLLNELMGVKETALFFFNENQTSLIPVSPNTSSRSKYFVNNSLMSGALNGIFETGTHKIILDSLVYNIDGTKSYYLIVPFTGGANEKGVLLTLMPFSLTEGSGEITLIKVCLEMFLNKLEVIGRQEELKSAYNELQVYQSKLTNDYKLSAIGELTSGIVEDVLSPLQVILSSTEFLKKEDSAADEKVLDTINQQVKKVKTVINRLVKFAGTADSKNKIYPCSINKAINDFYQMFSSSLKNDNYECVLNLEDNIPSVLTNPNYINQILTNIFFLIKAGGSKAGGILIQTRYASEKIVVKFLSTDYFEELDNDTLNPARDVNLKIIKNLMLQHQGEIKFDSNKSRGTVITLSFPLKRNIIR